MNYLIGGIVDISFIVHSTVNLVMMFKIKVSPTWLMDCLMQLLTDVSTAPRSLDY